MKSLKAYIPAWGKSLSHRIIAVLAAIFYRFPSRKLKVIGITGTDGKTSSTIFTTAILRAAGKKVAMVNGLQFQVGEKTWKNSSDNSTPGRFMMQSFLRQAVDAGCEYAVIEVTSWGIEQSRVWGVDFDAVGITNFSHEHLDLHGSMENYKRAKGKLFAQLMKSKKKKEVSKIAVLNKDDDEYAYFSSFPADRHIAYSIQEQADLWASDIHIDNRYASFHLHAGDQVVNIELSLPAKFNVYNALLAASLTRGLGIQMPSIKKGLESVTYIPGRMESIDEGQPFQVIVDYAHTPEGLKNLFMSARERIPESGKVIAIYGATGGRDPSRRPLIGNVAGQLVDMSILTIEDPRKEDPMDIAKDIEKGLKAQHKEFEKDYIFQMDRRAAIRKAFEMAGSEDIVLLCSLGHQTQMYVGDGKVDWDDREQARQVLSEMGYTRN